MELVNVMVRPLYFYCRETSNGIYRAMSIVWVLFDQLPLGFLPPQSMEVPGDLFTLLAALKEENISAVLCIFRKRHRYSKLSSCLIVNSVNWNNVLPIK